MKFFLDSANLDELNQALAWGIIDGVTTNPSLIAKEGVPMEDQLRSICELIDGDVSAPVVATHAQEMIAEGRALARVHSNIVVKVPITEGGIVAIRALTRDGIRTNATLCFTAPQAILAAKAGAYVVSPFIGRLDDIGESGVGLIADTAAIYNRFGYRTQILAASIRGPHHVVQAARAGAHIATLSFGALLALFHHPLTEKGLTQFLSDYNRAFEFAKA